MIFNAKIVKRHVKNVYYLIHFVSNVKMVKNYPLLIKLVYRIVMKDFTELFLLFTQEKFVYHVKVTFVKTAQLINALNVMNLINFKMENVIIPYFSIYSKIKFALRINQTNLEYIALSSVLLV